MTVQKINKTPKQERQKREGTEYLRREGKLFGGEREEGKIAWTDGI
jgi:hypothetical protein